MTFCQAQTMTKKITMDEYHGRGEVKKALIVMDKTISVPKEAVVYEAKYQIDDNAMSTKIQARDKAICELTKNNRCSVIVDPKIRISKKKGFFNVKISGYPAHIIDLSNADVFKRHKPVKAATPRTDGNAVIKKN